MTHYVEDRARPNKQLIFKDRLEAALEYLRINHGEGERRRYLEREWADELSDCLAMAHGKLNLLQQYHEAANTLFARNK